MSGNIFISYRRDDAAAWAGRLHMALEKHFRRDQLFMDVDSIQAGLDFAKVIDAEVAKCDVMLVVIGKGWRDAADASGQRRLDDPGDFVRLEVESALRRDIRVVPVLVDGASLPKAENLPEGMQGLVRRQAWPVSHARFGAECDELIRELSTVVPVVSRAESKPNETATSDRDAALMVLYTLAGFALFGIVAYFSASREIGWMAFGSASSIFFVLFMTVMVSAPLNSPRFVGSLMSSGLFFGAAVLSGYWSTIGKSALFVDWYLSAYLAVSVTVVFWILSLPIFALLKSPRSGSK